MPKPIAGLRPRFGISHGTPGAIFRTLTFHIHTSRRASPEHAATIIRETPSSVVPFALTVCCPSSELGSRLFLLRMPAYPSLEAPQEMVCWQVSAKNCLQRLPGKGSTRIRPAYATYVGLPPARRRTKRDACEFSRLRQSRRTDEAERDALTFGRRLQRI